MPKRLFVLSLMVKMLLPVACQLAYSWLHSSKSDDIMELLLFLMLQHRRKKPLPCHNSIQDIGIVAHWARSATQSLTSSYIQSCSRPPAQTKARGSWGSPFTREKNIFHDMVSNNIACHNVRSYWPRIAFIKCFGLPSHTPEGETR